MHEPSSYSNGPTAPPLKGGGRVLLRSSTSLERNMSVNRRKLMRPVLLFVTSSIVLYLIYWCIGKTKFITPVPLRRRSTVSQAQVLIFAHLGSLGRLGNQMFQVAATIGIAERHNLSWRFPTTISTSPIGRLMNLTGDFDLLNTPFTQIAEGSQIFHEISIPSEGNVRALSLHGYYQSPLYFAHSHKTLSQVLCIDGAPVARCKTGIRWR